MRELIARTRGGSANIASMIGVAGLVLGAGSLAH
jgi:hypothetical protein